MDLTGSTPWILTASDTKIPVSKDCVVYQATNSEYNDSAYKVSNLSAIKPSAKVWCYDTKKDADKNGVATVIIWTE